MTSVQNSVFFRGGWCTGEERNLENKKSEGCANKNQTRSHLFLCFAIWFLSGFFNFWRLQRIFFRSQCKLVGRSWSKKELCEIVDFKSSFDGFLLDLHVSGVFRLCEKKKPMSEQYFSIRAFNWSKKIQALGCAFMIERKRASSNRQNRPCWGTTRDLGRKWEPKAKSMAMAASHRLASAR